MLRSLKIVGLALVVLLLAGCGASEDAGQKGADGSGAKAVVGKVLVKQGPVAGATVTVKTDTGQLVGTATTNAEGEYRVPASQSGPFMAEAKEASGTTLYSVSQSSNMNITHLGDYLIREWYKAKGLDIASVFAGLTAGSPVPLEQELTVAANQILAVAANALGESSVDLFGNELTPTLSKILQATTIEGDGHLRIHLAEVNFNGVYTIKAHVTKNGEVVYEGKEETSSDQVPLTKGKIAATVGKVAPPAGSSAPTVSAERSNEHWMTDNWDYIKDKSMRDIVLPGTHDSGTYDIAYPYSKVAQTQTNSIGDQLKDGIRYFDLRVREAYHRGCADPSVWWIYHKWDSYRLQTALDEIVAFLQKPGNEKEVIVLDFQDANYIYQDERAKSVLAGMIQDKLGEYMTDDRVRSLDELVKKKKRVLVFVQDDFYRLIQNSYTSPAGCYGKNLNFKIFQSRDEWILSFYDGEKAEDYRDIEPYVVDAQLNYAAAEKNGLTESFNEYKTARGRTKLRVLQLVTKPSDTWYAAAYVTTPGLLTSNLLSYAVANLNHPLNFHPTKGCAEGWLGKRLRMGLEGGSDKWNPPNVIITDNYKDTGGGVAEWLVPDYKNGRWEKSFSGSFVDMIIELNKITPGDRLKNVTDMKDGQCLQ